jgi:hypothetical protein
MAGDRVFQAATDGRTDIGDRAGVGEILMFVHTPAKHLRILGQVTGRRSRPGRN